MESVKLVPESRDAEQAVLGAILLGMGAIFEVVDILTEDSFYDPAHRKIFSAMMEMLDRNEPIDLLTISERLARGGVLEEIGGPSYLASLLNSIPYAHPIVASSPSNVRRHARIVQEAAQRRNLIQTGEGLVEKGYGRGGEDVEDVLSWAERELFKIICPGEGELVSVPELLSPTFDAIEKAYREKRHVTGVASGFITLDKMTSGFQAGDMVIVAGRPSIGKTAFCLNVIRNAALDTGLKAVMFSLEMNRQALMMRLFCMEARISSREMRSGYLTSSQWQKCAAVAEKLNKAGIWIDDTSRQTARAIKAKARRFQKKNGLDLVVVDYLQLMEMTEMRGRSRNDEVAEAVRSLKAMAKDLGVPVIVVSQLSRKIEDRRGGRPKLSDLRESGAIEQDADIVLFICRGEGERVAEVIVAKQRNGPTGLVKLTFLKEYTRFENPAAPSDQTKSQFPELSEHGEDEEAPF